MPTWRGTPETLLVQFKARRRNCEHDLEGDAIRFMPGGAVFVKETTPIRDANKVLGLHMPTATDVTIAGTMLGRIPAKGDSFTFGNFRFYVERLSGRRIVLMRISPLSPSTKTRWRTFFIPPSPTENLNRESFVREGLFPRFAP
ncbi:hypothetical protein FDZ71_11500 [bacterium]|nr:MAG: hypothetical protein FDZ71_11500 [bacterium]